MDTATKATCEEQLAALRDLHERGLITDNIYHKGVICIAAEYFDGEEPDFGAAVLMSVPVSYFRDGQQLADIVEDPQYYTLCARLASQLGIWGYLSNDLVPHTGAKA